MIIVSEGGVIIPIKLTPKASKNESLGWKSEELVVRICAPPIEGAANEALLRFIAKQLETNRSSVRIHSGDKSRHKKVFVHGVSKEFVLSKFS